MDCLKNDSVIIKITMITKKGKPFEMTGRLIWLNRIYEDSNQNFRFGLNIKEHITIADFLEE